MLLVRHWTATLETNQDGKHHLHLMLEFTSKVDRTAGYFVFEGRCPNVRPNDLLGEAWCGRRWRVSVDRGHFYVCANKKGTVRDAAGKLCVAAYFVAPRSQRLTSSFAAALRAGKLKSWLGDAGADCSWLAGRLGDVYPHETVISHLRRGLDHRFPRSTPGETRARFARRMGKVEDYMNSPEFKQRDGGGLASLAEALRERCRRVSLLQGERLRT